MNTTHLVPWNWFRRDSRIAPARGRVISGPVMPLYTEFDRLFDSLFNPEFQPALVNGSNTQLGESVIRPNLDISGDDKNYYVSVEVPGVEAKDLHVEVENDTLRIRGSSSRRRRLQSRACRAREELLPHRTQLRLLRAASRPARGCGRGGHCRRTQGRSANRHPSPQGRSAARKQTYRNQQGLILSTDRTLARAKGESPSPLA